MVIFMDGHGAQGFLSLMKVGSFQVVIQFAAQVVPHFNSHDMTIDQDGEKNEKDYSEVEMS